MSFTDPLPKNVSLQVFNHDDLIFESSGKWLYPLFEFEKFLETYSGPRDMLSSHDSALGKAAAVLSLRFGIKKINAEILSEVALNYINSFNAEVRYNHLVPKLMCATENILEEYDDEDLMYSLLRQRAKLIQGVDVSVKNLNHPFINKKDLSFELKAGSHLMILGENGTGKTTLLRLLCGIEKNYKGEILIDNKSPDSLKKFTIGYIPQFTDNSLFSLSCREVVSFGISSKTKNKNEIIEKALLRLSALHLADRSFSTLSGGEKQKIHMARCLAQNSKIFLLDEPTANLDAENKKIVMDILCSLTISEIPTIIVVTHDKELVQMRGWDKLVIGVESD
ncbi:DUF1893 domain-containing protein [Treponema sp.]|uniref:ABC transporter ATP-binding protein n=1 Tax=Treponema sp. TaxID=166 RepID=UPI00388F547E